MFNVKKKKSEKNKFIVVNDGSLRNSFMSVSYY